MRLPSAIGRRVCGAALSVALVSLPLMAADKVSTPAPVPAQILTARKVFISNAGANGNAFGILQRAGDIDQPYNQFYAAMKSWGRFEIVGAPSDAELVFEIRFNIQFPIYATAQPAVLGLTILDSRTHFILWTIAEPVESANLAKTWEKNINQGIANLVGGLKALAQPAAGGATNK
jgi:hypothetical protein